MRWRSASRRDPCSRCCAGARPRPSASTGSRTSSPPKLPRPTPATGHPSRSCSRRSSTPTSGRVNLFKVLQGTVKSDASLVNGRTMTDERLHQLTVMRGKEQDPVAEVSAGDIAAVAKLNDTTTGDVLGARGAELEVAPFVGPEPVLAAAIRAQVEGRRRQARQRAAPAARRGSRAAARAQRRDPPDVAVGHGRDAHRDRARAPAAQVRRRSRDRRREGGLPRDDHRQARRPKAGTRSRPVATASSALRSSASSHSSAGAASSSRTRSSAARSPVSSSPRSRRACTRRWNRVASSASRSSTCA